MNETTTKTKTKTKTKPVYTVRHADGRFLAEAISLAVAWDIAQRQLRAGVSCYVQAD